MVQHILQGRIPASVETSMPRPIFNVREDDYSFQVTSPTSRRFFLRITPKHGDEKEVMFSDFTLEPDDSELAIQALHELENHRGRPQPGATLRFLDIYPIYHETRNQEELIRRHNQIVDVAKTYLSNINLTLENTFLDQRAGKFDTVIATNNS